MIDIKSEPVEMVLDHRHHCKSASIRRQSSCSPVPSPMENGPEIEPCEEFPILYGLLTAPKSFKPKNSEELQLLPPMELFSDSKSSIGGDDLDNQEDGGVRVTSRVKVMQCRRRRDTSAESVDLEEDSQSFDFSRSRSLSSSPHMVDSSSNSNLSAPDFSSGASSNGSQSGEIYESEDESTCSLVGSLEENSCSGGYDSADDNIPTSTTSGFKRKACRLETAIGNIVKRRVRVQKRSNNHTGSNSNSNNVPISLAPSSPTVSTTCVDPPTPPPSRGRSEILERILRSTNNTTPNQQHSPALRRSCNNEDNNNNEGGYDGPYAKLRDLLTMSEDQLVKRRRLEYGLNENDNAKVHHNAGQSNHDSEEPTDNPSQRRREFSPPRNNILASLLQKGRAPYEPTSSSSPFNQNHNNHQSPMRSLPSLLQINGNSSGKMLGGNSRLNVIVNMNDERPYKCSLCDLRFKKLPLLNRHVKTHSHIKRYVCRFCSHAFKRSDNLLAHMRTSCKGIKDADTQFAGGQVRSAPPPTPSRNNLGGQIINQLLSAPPNAGGIMVSRSQLEEALLNLGAHSQEEQPEKRYSAPLSPLVSTTTASPPPPLGRLPADLQSSHSKLLEILSGSPVNRFPVPVIPVEDNEEDAEDEEEEEQDMPLPLSLKVDRRASSPPPICSSSSSSQYRRSHHLVNNQLRNALYPNELPHEEESGEEQVGGENRYVEDEVENDSEQPLNLGRSALPPPQSVSAKSRDHPEIVSILSRQPKSNVVMLAAADLRKLVGLDTL